MGIITIATGILLFLVHKPVQKMMRGEDIIACNPYRLRY